MSDEILTVSSGLTFCHGKEQCSEGYKKRLPKIAEARPGQMFPPPNPEEFGAPSKIKRIIPVEEVAEADHYWDLAELAVIFNHDIVETDKGTWRWRANSFMGWISDYAGVYTPSSVEEYANGMHGYGQHSKEFRASLSLNTLVVDLQYGAFSVEEWMKFYMQIGYSLSGYCEVFGQREASEYGLPGAKQRTEEDDEDQYVETILDYMRRKHAGKVLKL